MTEGEAGPDIERAFAGRLAQQNDGPVGGSFRSGSWLRILTFDTSTLVVMVAASTRNRATFIRSVAHLA